MAHAKPGEQRRKVRSYVMRAGRTTPGQQRALARLWTRYGIDMPEDRQPLDLVERFGNSHPVVLDIGFGDGAAIIEMALARPELNLLGVEVHRPGVGRLLMCLETHQLGNVRVIHHDAIEVLAQGLAPGSVPRVQLFFPDPWPKKRHHKRRIVQPGFLDLLQHVLAPGGHFHFATDWQDYAEYALALCEADARLVNIAGAGNYSPRPPYRPVTKFERRGLAKGHGTWDLIYRRR